jgi:hypothetical protein
MTIFWMLPERFRIDVNADESTVVGTVHVHPHLFERLGTYQDPLFEENWDEGKKLLNEQFRKIETGGYVFDPYERSFTTAVAQIQRGGSAVVRTQNGRLKWYMRSPERGPR